MHWDEVRGMKTTPEMEMADLRKRVEALEQPHKAARRARL